jgi:hypothetical protein
MMSSGSASVLTCFTQYDVMKLQRVVGAKQARKMLNGKKSAFLFM